MSGVQDGVITASADGSSLSNPGPAGWAWYIDEQNWAAGGWPRGTNNQGELKAVADLLASTAHTGRPLLILCDSQYVINSVTKWLPGWKRRGWRRSDGGPVLNRELLEAIDQAIQGREVSFEWVKGHAGHELNEAADLRAHAAALAFQQGLPPDRGPGFTLTAAGPRPAPTAGEPALFELGQPAAAIDPEVATVLGLQRQLLDPAVRANPARLAELLHPDYTEYSAAGRIRTRNRLLSLPDQEPGSIRLESMGASRLGPDAVLLRWRARSPLGDELRSSVWVRRGGDWRLLFGQGTPTPA